MIKKFIYDMIHMTEGEKFVSYWYIWLILIVAVFLILYLTHKK